MKKILQKMNVLLNRKQKLKMVGIVILMFIDKSLKYFRRIIGSIADFLIAQQGYS